jgi:hypothetical protein
MSSDPSEIDPIAVAVKVAAAKSGLSKWTIYDLANKGEIETVYHGSRRLVVWASLRDYIANLPTERPETVA